MKGRNYQIQAAQAKRQFLTYDQNRLIAKFGLKADEAYLYTEMLHQPYRVDRHTGDLQKLEDGGWVDGNSYEEVMTLLDLLCDSRDDRRISGQWKNMQSFGLMFHQNLLEEQRDPIAERFQETPDILINGCAALRGEPIAGGDIAYGVELFDGLRIGIQFWYGDEEFAPRLRYLWDENAMQYIRYETMFFAVPLLLRRIQCLGAPKSNKAENACRVPSVTR